MSELDDVLDRAWRLANELEQQNVELQEQEIALREENAELRKALSAADTYVVCLEEELESLRLHKVSK